MAILIIEYLGIRQAGTLKGRVLIGRWPDNTVVIDDKAVSRIHAWIGLQDGRFYIADAGSRTGTFVNGEPLNERHVLGDGDQIRIGPAVMKYRTDPAPPADTDTIDLAPRAAADLSGEQGIFMDCVCGAPLWLPREFTGIGQCRYCGHTVNRMPGGKIEVPAPKPSAPALKPAAASTPTSSAPIPSPSYKPAGQSMPKSALPPRAEGEQICGVCQSPITVFDEITNCPSCSLAFHADCWLENHGCSAYGCPQVGALNVK